MRLGSFISGIVLKQGIVQKPVILNQFLSIMVLILGLLTQQEVKASVLNKMSIKDMAKQSKQVQIGEVVSTWVSPDPDQKMFYTFVKVKVEKTIKGKPVQEILLRQPGGTYHDPVTKKTTRQKVFGMESFQKGEKALFFITYANDGAPMVMFQGKQQIVKDQKTGIEMTIHESNPRDVEFAGSHAMSNGEEKSFYATYEEKPLDEMVSEIQGAMNMQKGETKN